MDISSFGYLGIFICVFIEQIGAPIPAMPMLFGAGTLIGSGKLSVLTCVVASVSASITADLIWYSLGRIRGPSVLTWICRLSWQPGVCVTNTKSFFSIYGAKTLLFSKFVPGLSVLASPLAGITEISLVTFLYYDIMGAFFWAALPLGAGVFFRDHIPSFNDLVHGIVSHLPALCAVLLAGYLGWRYWVLRQYRARLAAVCVGKGITPDELNAKMEQGEDFIIIDVRHQLDVEQRPQSILRSRWVPFHELTSHVKQLPVDKLVIVYCDCPKDDGAVEATRLLQKHGIRDVRPMIGGLALWEEKGFQTQEIAAAG